MQKQIDDIMASLENREDLFFDRLDPKFLKVQTNVTTRHGQLIEEWLLQSVDSLDHMESTRIEASVGETEVDAVLINHETRRVLLLEVKRKAGQNSTSLKSISRKIQAFPEIAKAIIPEGYGTSSSCFYYYAVGAMRENITAEDLNAFCGANIVAKLESNTTEFIDRLNG